MKVRGDFLGPPRSTDKITLIIKVSKGAKIRNRYNQVPLPDPGYQWESDKLKVRHHKRETRGQLLILLLNLKIRKKIDYS